MIIHVTMKDPDVLHEAIEEAVKEDVAKLGLNAVETEALETLRTESEYEIASQWFEYGEYLTVEIDTKAKTIRVMSEEELEKLR